MDKEVSQDQAFARLQRLYGDLENSLELLDAMINREFRDRIALVSSFGAESVVLLDLVAQVNPATPVIFLNTKKLFGETLKYRDTLVEQLGLTNLVTIEPDEEEVRAEDHNGLLWTRDTDACCDLRKVRPLARAMNQFDAWITGRKRFQSSTRSSIPLVELDGSKVKVNPLAYWSQEEVDKRIGELGLPAHPLVAQGFPSIGCMPCTHRVEAGQDRRAGRWAGQDKTECGIHIGANI
ncbi:phosphoadenylyl-sulfate reductase [Emcibacter nanhaiensis]|uniref:Adenosine 5'-phosphosulfate reductase n=2 Tax=Emcibacter nanhaiensis TaxID=1505037 RepID=A0A501PLZ6_9PROT|nr:phosphoadenylyl-sulfate reductase [Emcibacter nanhaiensis]